MASLPRRIDVPNEDVCQCLVSSTACVPCLDDPGHFVDPRHGDSSTGFEHNDGAGIRSDDLLDQGILVIRQRQTRQIHILGQPLVRKDDCDVRVLRQVRGGFQIGTGIKLNLRVRQFCS